MNLGSENSSDEGFSDINITPFVDVVLVLLVIFMVTAPLMVKNIIDLKLPSAESSDKSQTNTVGIVILKTGNVLLEGVLSSPQLIADRIKAEKAKDSKTQVVITADKDATHGMVIEVIDLVKSSGISNFAFQIEKKEKVK